MNGILHAQQQKQSADRTVQLCTYKQVLGLELELNSREHACVSLSPITNNTEQRKKETSTPFQG